MKAPITLLLLLPPSLAFLTRMDGTGKCVGSNNEASINGRFADGIEEEDCRHLCASTKTCNGFAHSSAYNNGECILYGPDLDGACTVDSLLRSDCATAGGNWTAPPAPWGALSFPTSDVAGSQMKESASWRCWKFAETDHMAQCEGTADDPSIDCEVSFRHKEETERTKQNCPFGCTFVPAPTESDAKEKHPGDVGLPGWPPPLPGVCRGGARATNQLNAKYAPAAAISQKQCADECLREPGCTGYNHGPYCAIFGEGVAENAEGYWTAAVNQYTVVTGTEENIGYICFTSTPRLEREKVFGKPSLSAGPRFYRAGIALLPMLLLLVS